MILLSRASLWEAHRLASTVEAATVQEENEAFLLLAAKQMPTVDFTDFIRTLSFVFYCSLSSELTIHPQSLPNPSDETHTCQPSIPSVCCSPNKAAIQAAHELWRDISAFFLNWDRIALQCWVSFCCKIKWINYKCVCVCVCVCVPPAS